MRDMCRDWGGKVGGRGDGYILVGKRTVRLGRFSNFLICMTQFQ